MPERILALFLLLLPLAGKAETLSGKVVGVTDGDTVTLLVADRPMKIRLAEIDTPERGQPWASRAKQALSEMVFGQQAVVLVVNADRYGRGVGHIRIGGQDINREMVRGGHAWVYRRYLEDQTLLDDESHAQEAKVGLWSLPESERVPPWDWRRGKRSMAPKPEPMSPGSFSCNTKKKCSEMASCTEARFQLQECGFKGLDRDGDGVPCEALCGEQRSSAQPAANPRDDVV